jgi:hypothetical protein
MPLLLFLLLPQILAETLVGTLGSCNDVNWKNDIIIRADTIPPIVTFPFQLVVAMGGGWGWYRPPASTTSHGVMVFGRLWVVPLTTTRRPTRSLLFGSGYVYFETFDLALMIVELVEALYKLRREHFDFFVHLQGVNRSVAKLSEIDVVSAFDRVASTTVL